jgi:hypothetical protein
MEAGVKLADAGNQQHGTDDVDNPGTGHYGRHDSDSAQNEHRDSEPVESLATGQASIIHIVVPVMLRKRLFHRLPVGIISNRSWLGKPGKLPITQLIESNGNR